MFCLRCGYLAKNVSPAPATRGRCKRKFYYLNTCCMYRMRSARSRASGMPAYRVRHAIGRHGFLRIRDVGVQRLRRPGDAALLERGGIAEVIQFRRPSPEDSVKARSDAVDAALGRVTRVAFLEQLLAVLRIALRVRDPGGEERGRGRGGNRQPPHADTIAPGFFM